MLNICSTSMLNPLFSILHTLQQFKSNQPLKGDRIKEARVSAGYNQPKLAKIIGVTKGAISQWEKENVQNLKNHHLFALSKATGYSAEWIATGEGAKLISTDTQDIDDAQNVEPGISNAVRVPVISYDQVGTWDKVMNPYDLDVGGKWLSWPTLHSDQSFCVRVKGPSMEPEYMHGGYILVDPSVEAVHGKDVVVRTPDGKVTFKKLQIGPEGKHLLAINKDFPQRIVELPENTVICGVVIGYFKDTS